MFAPIGRRRLDPYGLFVEVGGLLEPTGWGGVPGRVIERGGLLGRGELLGRVVFEERGGAVGGRLGVEGREGAMGRLGAEGRLLVLGELRLTRPLELSPELELDREPEEERPERGAPHTEEVEVSKAPPPSRAVASKTARGTKSVIIASQAIFMPCAAP